MAKLIIYYAHPGQSHSRINTQMAKQAMKEPDVTFIDLYAQYPRFAIDVDKEQCRLLEHDVVLFQFPIFWYSTPSIVKEWLDLVLEQGFAYGEGSYQLKGKTLILAVTTAGSADAYTIDGYHKHELRTFLTPLEQTAMLCEMQFSPPYVLFGALHAPENGEAKPHIDGYQQLIRALRDDTYDFKAAAKLNTITHTDIAKLGGKVNG